MGTSGGAPAQPTFASPLQEPVLESQYQVQGQVPTQPVFASPPRHHAAAHPAGQPQPTANSPGHAMPSPTASPTSTRTVQNYDAQPVLDLTNVGVFPQSPQSAAVSRVGSMPPAAAHSVPPQRPAVNRMGSMPPAAAHSAALQQPFRTQSILQNPVTPSPPANDGSSASAAQADRRFNHEGELTFKRPRAALSPAAPSRYQSMPTPSVVGDLSPSARHGSMPTYMTMQSAQIRSPSVHQAGSLFDESPGPMLTYPVVPLDAVDVATQDASDMLQSEGGSQSDAWQGFQSPPRQQPSSMHSPGHDSRARLDEQEQQGRMGWLQRTAAEPLLDSPSLSHAHTGTPCIHKASDRGACCARLVTHMHAWMVCAYGDCRNL